MSAVIPQTGSESESEFESESTVRCSAIEVSSLRWIVCQGIEGACTERGRISVCAPGAWKRRNRSAFDTTVTEDRAIDAAAKIGSSRIPVNGYRTPIAIGIRTTL